MSRDKIQSWDDVLSAASRLQEYLPGAVLVGGTVAAIYAGHRHSFDADHIMTDLREYFDDVLGQLESVAGCQTARVKRPVMILGSLDGVETGVRQLIRTRPLETETFYIDDEHFITLPTAAEILRIKASLILKRNATRDYIDCAAIADFLGVNEAAQILSGLEEYYPQEGRAIQQIVSQLSEPTPFDLSATNLAEYKRLDPKWHNWEDVAAMCRSLADNILRTADAPKM